MFRRSTGASVPRSGSEDAFLAKNILKRDRATRAGTARRDRGRNRQWLPDDCDAELGIGSGQSDIDAARCSQASVARLFVRFPLAAKILKVHGWPRL